MKFPDYVMQELRNTLAIFGGRCTDCLVAKMCKMLKCVFLFLYLVEHEVFPKFGGVGSNTGSQIFFRAM